MIGVLIGAVGSIAIILGWIAIASYAYCRLSGHMEMFVWPYDQWLDIAPYLTVTGWTKVDVIVSAIIASLPLAAIGYGIWLRQRRKLRHSFFLAQPEDR